MSVGTRRNELEIIRDILLMDSGGTTMLRYSVNLSHLQMQKYLCFLAISGLIELRRHENRALTFQVTQKGQLVLEKLEQLFNLMGLDSLDETSQPG